MFCPNCGSKILDTANFCMKCGAGIPDVESGEPANFGFTPESQPSGPYYNNSAFAQSPARRAYSKTGLVFAIVIIVALIVGLILLLVKCSSAAETQEPQKIQLNGTYGDTLGLFEFSFRGDTVSITAFGLYIGDAKYEIDEDKMYLLDFELLGLGYVSDGETVLDFEFDDYSILLEGLRLKKK